tara:strand:- start:127 stop:1764 length:1638 start_codon:yes stop_codon:yes gene_type:complete
MFRLKSIYFYFLAIKIILNKFLKEFYFSTRFYNNSLKEKYPNDFHFYPNSYLLSSFINHKNFSFKISDISIEDFWNQKNLDNLNNFYWLSLINRKHDSKTIQKIISLWIEKNKTYKRKIWNNSNVSKRIISWILNADIILKNTNLYFKENFFQSITLQVNHLKKNLHSENSPTKKIEIIAAVLLSGLVFKEFNNNFNISIKELKKILNEFFDEDGFPISRSIYDLVQCSKFLVLIRECCKDAQEYIPDYLDAIVEKIVICVNSLKTNADKNPLFNGACEFKINDYLNYLSGLDYNLKKTKKSIGQICVLKNKKTLIFFDHGEPPEKRFSNNYQSGPLSFEYYIDDKKIITNCGYGNKISKKAELVSRLTSAQSTVTVNDTSVTKFERNKLINVAFGTSIKSSFKIKDYDYQEDNKSISVSAKHNAYQENFGLIHLRNINLQKENGNLYGQDQLIFTKNSGSTYNYSIRFHLYPGIIPVQTLGGSSILIPIERNKSLIFITNEENLKIEKSIFLGRNEILNNFCINISGQLKNEDKLLKWQIKKNI